MEPFKEQAFDLFDEIVKAIPDTAPRSMHKGLLRSTMSELLRAYTSGEADGRHTEYSVRLVLHRHPSDDIVTCTPWEHGVHGLPNVWRHVAAMCDNLSRGMWGHDAPPELSERELMGKSGTARVSMSRKVNGVAAVRVRFQTMTGGARLTPGGPARPEDWCLRIDIGSELAGRTLDKQEREAGSPLVVG